MCVCVCTLRACVSVREYKGHFKNDANILDIIYGTAKLKMFAELFCAYVVGWLELIFGAHSLLSADSVYVCVCVSLFLSPKVSMRKVSV